MVKNKFSPSPIGLAALFLACRLVTLIGIPPLDIAGYGDFWSFYHLAEIKGLPFIHYWMEFPPLFAFLSEGIFFLSNHQEHIYRYLLSFLLLTANAGVIYFFEKMDRLVNPKENLLRSFIMALVILALPYSHIYFDPLALVFMMAGLWSMIQEKNFLAGLMAALGGLTKFFPLILAVGLWKKNWRKWVIFFAPIIIIFGVVYGILYYQSPEFTWASITSQGNKGSWETIWAMIDGNYRSGNFGPLWERLDPATAARPMGNPPRISSLLTLAIFGLLGFIGLLKSEVDQDHKRIAVVGFTLTIFFLWSPGWSVQWVLYLIPLILLVVPGRMAILLVFGHIMVNLLEWPVFLARNRFDLLPLTIGLRTFLMMITGLSFFRILRSKRIQP